MKSIQEILESRRKTNELELENRINEVEDNIPRVKEINSLIKEKNFSRIKNLVNGFETEKLTKEINELENELSSLLKENDYPIDYLDMKYHCDICKDTGVNGTKICECRKRLNIKKHYHDSNLEKILEYQNFDTFDINVYRKSRQNDEIISPYENMVEIRDELYEYATNFTRDSLSLYLFGPVGTGKTFMINCIAKEVLDAGYSVVYLSEPDLVNTILEYKYAYSNDKQEILPRVESIYNADLLIIDDLGSNTINENSKSAVFEVINKRLTQYLPVIISSNLDTEELRELYDTRIYSRIVGKYYARNFYGNDIRMQ